MCIALASNALSGSKASCNDVRTIVIELFSIPGSVSSDLIKGIGTVIKRAKLSGLSDEW
jgi:hypothetical protein